MKGFFSESTWLKIKEPLSLVPLCGKCGLEKHCNSPKMPVSGLGKKRILIVAESPGQNEDDRGIQLCGNAGNEAIRILHKVGLNMRKDCWLTNALICRPWHKNEKGNVVNRKPTNHEIDYCRPNLAKTLAELQPDIIVPMGDVALRSLIPLAWKEGEVEDVGTWVGWQIPCHKLNAWICPTYHPSFLIREDEEERRVNPVAEMLVTKHLRVVERLKGKPFPNGPPDYQSRVKITQDSDFAAEVATYMIESALIEDTALAFDYETTMLKPDSKDAAILCCSLSDGQTSIAAPWRGRFVEVMKKFFRSPIKKIAANIRFEDRWTRKQVGVIVRNWWWDTVLGAHWLDPRGGICSLKFQGFVQLGVEDYDSHVEPMKKGKGGGGNALNRMKDVDINDMLTYCGLDSLYEWIIAHMQREKLKCQPTKI